MSAVKPDMLARAQECWPEPPDWVLALAEACNASSQTAVAKRLGYSGPTISQAISNTYRADLAPLADMVRGALMHTTVECPVRGELGRHVCLTWQKKPFAATSSDRVRMYHACRSGCPHSKLKQGDENA